MHNEQRRIAHQEPIQRGGKDHASRICGLRIHELLTQALAEEGSYDCKADQREDEGG